jgi:hypothetical protein
MLYREALLGNAMKYTLAQHWHRCALDVLGT